MPLEILSNKEQEKQRLRSLKEMLHRYSVPAAEAAGRAGGERRRPLLRVRPSLPRQARPRRGLPRPLQRQRHAARSRTAMSARSHATPIEKKPFFHVLPGSDALTFGMLGCDYHCGYCQNWVTSQMLRDPDAVAAPRETTPRQLVDLAFKHGAPVVASSYNEPLITSEWAVDVFKEAKGRGLRCAYISNGNGTPQVLDFIRPFVDAYKVDLKTFDPKHYRELGGVMENVTDTIRMLKARGFWVEIVTLVVPGFSDDPDDLKRMADFLASVDPLMPWHMTAFHPDYKMTDGLSQHDCGRPDAHRRLRNIGGPQVHVPGQSAGAGRRVGKHALPSLQRHGDQAVWVSGDREPGEGRRPVSVVPSGAARHLGKAGGHGDGRVRSLL